MTTRLGEGEEEGALFRRAVLVIAKSAYGRSGVHVRVDQVELELEQEGSFCQQLVEEHAFSIY